MYNYVLYNVLALDYILICELCFIEELKYKGLLKINLTLLLELPAA